MFANNYRFHPQGFKLSTRVADIHFTLLVLAGLSVYRLHGLYAIVAFVLLLGGVYAHEAGHWLMAKTLGYRRRRIALHAFAPAITEDAVESLRHEFLMAAMGPIVSFVLGGMLFWAASFFHHAMDVRFFFLETGRIILAWSLLHLLPFLPFDGGRVAFRIWMCRSGAETAVKRMVSHSQMFCLAIVVMAFLGAIANLISWMHFVGLCGVAAYLFMIRLVRMPEILRIASASQPPGNVATVSPPPYTKKERPQKIPITKE